MTELPTENMYCGVPEAREGVIERIQNNLSFAILQGRAFAGFVVGPQRVGKTTAVLAVEQGLRETLGLVASYEAVATTDPNLVYVKAAPGLDLGACPIQFWSEIPIQDKTILERIAADVHKRGRRVLVDIVNKEYPSGDTRNNTEAADVLNRIFKRPHIEHLYAKLEGSATYQGVRMRSTNDEIDLEDPKFNRALQDHKRRVAANLKSNFVGGKTYVNDAGELVTELVFVGDPNKIFGSPYGQSVNTRLPF